MNGFRLLILADLHYAPGAARADVNHPARRADIAIELVRRAADDARRRGPVHAVALLGDLLNDGTSLQREQGAAAHAGAIADVRRVLDLALPDAPVLAVPGNHDGDYDAFYAALGTKPGLHEIAGVRFLALADRYAQGDVATRSDADRQALAAQAGGNGPLIVLQHNPMHPVIDDPYPYMLTNRREVMADYSRAGVTLSLSGHYHTGQPASTVDGVRYFTCPALCQRPFGYATATIDAGAVLVQTHALAMSPELAVWDSHAHTEFAFCGEGTSAAAAAARADDMGLAGVCLVEHAPQLYVSKEDFWAGRHVFEPGSWRRGTSRMAAYRQAVSPLRSERVKVGLEVELDAAGELTLLEEDRWWLDVLVGAVHFLHPDAKTLSDRDITRLFLEVTEKLIAAGIDVLAHPLRALAWAKRPVPAEITPRLVQLLAASNTAAEINFHHNLPEADFFRQCVQAGVKVSFGSDAHGLYAVGNFGAHLALLRQAAQRDNVADLLWRPR